MISIRTLFALTAFVAAASAVRAGTADAQSASAQAELLFRQGRDLMTAGKLAEACAAFDESEKLEPAPTTLLNLGACREKNGQLASAWGAYLDAERQTRTAGDAAGQQLHQISSDKAQKLEPRVSKLTISVPADSQIDRLEITRGNDRVDPAMWNRALPVDGGTYKISAGAPGTTAWSTTVNVAAERDSKTVDIPKLPSLAPQPATTPSTASTNTATTPTTTTTTGAMTANVPAAPSPAHHSRTARLLVGAGALVLFGGGLGFDLWGNSTYDDAKAEMSSQSRRDSLYDSANDKRYAAEAFAVGGVACAAVAIWLFVRHGDESPPVTGRVELVPTTTGFALAGAF